MLALTRLAIYFLDSVMRFIFAHCENNTSEEWAQDVVVPSRALEQLAYVVLNLEVWTKKPIEDPQRILRLRSKDLDYSNVKELAADSGVGGSFVYDVAAPNKFRYLLFDRYLKATSSSYRELQGVWLAVHDSVLVPDGSKLIFRTDSKVVVSWLEHGTSKRLPSDLLRQIALKAHARDISIYPTWVPRSSEIIQYADLSKE